MRYQSNAFARTREAAQSGLVLAAIGVLAFSFSLPATKLAVADFNPFFVAFGRATIAAILAGGLLRAGRAPRPTRRQAVRLVVVAAGVVFGFPLLTTLALQSSGSAHGAVIIALLPAATAAFAVLRGGERPGPVFWAGALTGLAVVLAFSLARSGGRPGVADLEILVATVLCALGYAEGGALSRELGGARTICWALVLALPVSLPITIVATAHAGLHGGASAWLGLAYVSLISMFLGFFAWYAGLARAGVARASQLQLAQPLLTIGWSALVLGEAVAASTLLAAVGVLASVVVTQRARITPASSRRGRKFCAF